MLPSTLEARTARTPTRRLSLSVPTAAAIQVNRAMLSRRSFRNPCRRRTSSVSFILRESFVILSNSFRFNATAGIPYIHASICSTYQGDRSFCIAYPSCFMTPVSTMPTLCYLLRLFRFMPCNLFLCILFVHGFVSRPIRLFACVPVTSLSHITFYFHEHPSVMILSRLFHLLYYVMQ